MTRVSRSGLLVLLLLAPLSTAAAQSLQQAQLHIAVVDQSGASIPGARVRLVREQETLADTAADERGEVTLTALPTGAVRLHVEFDGFAPYDGAVNVRRGSTNRTITLRIAAVREEVVVTEGADDARGNAFTTTLDEDEIAALPDDPDELRDHAPSREAVEVGVRFAGGGELHTSVYPLILRGVRLLGVDSTLPWDLDGYPTDAARWAEWREERLRLWALVAESLSPEALRLIHAGTIGLDEIAEHAPRILNGEVAGRLVVELARRGGG